MAIATGRVIGWEEMRVERRVKKTKTEAAEGISNTNLRSLKKCTRPTTGD